MGIKKERIFTIVKFVFPLFLLILAIFEMRKFARGLNVNLLNQELNNLQPGTLVIILLITLVAVFPMFFYDIILVQILGFRVPKKELLEYSFIANSFSNLIGFGGLIGAMLRTYFYHTYDPDKKRLVGGIASVSLFYLTGISLFSWIVVLFYRRFPLFIEEKWLYFAVIGISLYLPVFILVHWIKSKKEEQNLITFSVGKKLVLVSLMEWSAIFAVILLLSKLLGISIQVQSLFPVFIIASCAGIISMIPGGLGSFDLIFIWGMQGLHAPAEKILVLLLFYRIGYYVLPFLISLVLFVLSFWQKWNKSWNNLPKAILQGFSHILLTALVFIAGLILLLSASVPGILSRLKIAQEFLSLPIMNLSHQLSVAAGFLLLGLSRGIEYSVKRTYALTMGALVLAALFSIFKGIDYEEAAFLITVAIILRLSKGQFYRESYVMTWGKTVFDVLLVVIITSMYLLIGYSNLPSARFNMPRTIQPYIILDYRDLFNSAIIGLAIAFIIMLFGYLISRPRKWTMIHSHGHEVEILKHFSHYKTGQLAHLVFLHDKYIYWNRKKNVIFMYKPYADKLVVLGDPIGEKAEIASAIQEFHEVADIHGYTPVFYQVSDEMFAYLHGNGYAFFKLGEEASVDLEKFHLSIEKKRDSNPVGLNFSSQGYEFEVIKPPYTKQLIAELEEISASWLEGRMEKGFSVGFFDESYMNRGNLAIVKNSDNKLIAFAAILPNQDLQRTVSAELLRFLPSVSSEAVEWLFLSLCAWARKHGYRRFNLGMIPLENVGLSRFSFLSERIAAQIFLHGHFIDQSRKLTEKFADRWEPKYLAYRRKSSLPLTMLQITLLISKKRT
ncbi:bifunctional lysylphosphatidylglycerol flippase/synthetase MprF [Neobacillus sp. SM06]|uniref:bifunctional lysylphosphatidylglycerol flippase/synthetase MprF n=1 Tax=Neobacillus sp. SM06 TaxID=3422492 RepID=UPI003D2DE065